MDSLSIILFILTIILVVIIITMLLYYLWTKRKRIFKNNLSYSIQQGTTSSGTDIFDMNEHDIYICNRTPINITLSGIDGKDSSGRLFYISNDTPQEAHTIAGKDLTLLHSSNIIEENSIAMYVFLDNYRLQRLI